MRGKSNEHVTLQNFGAFFLLEKFDAIYNQCNEEFKQLVSSEQFNEIAKAFNAMLQTMNYLENPQLIM